MSKPLSPTERTRLIGILGRLGSDHDGERAAAGLLASRMLRDKDLTWKDLLGGAPMPPAPLLEETFGLTPWRLQLNLAARHIHTLRSWEQEFVRNLLTRRRPPTQKQSVVLTEIAQALQKRGCA